MRFVETFLLSVASVSAPSPALSCSVCFLAGKDNLNAYFSTAILLSLLPFVLIGGLGLWLYRHAQESNTQLSIDNTKKNEIHFTKE